jgi:putative methyltransferase (TIGR04325 family)
MSRVRNLKTISQDLRSHSKGIFRKTNQAVDYNSDVLINSIVRKTIDYSKNISDGVFTSETYRTIAAIGMLPAEIKDLEVIDFGGGAGSHFSVSKKAFPRKNFKWLIIETPKMVSVCKEEGLKEILFATSIEEATVLLPDPDLIIMNASIHYSGNPLGTLKSLCELKSRWIYITRTPLTGSNNLLELLQESKLSKNGPGQPIKSIEDSMVVVPIQVVPKESFESILQEKYTIILKFEEESLYANSKAQNLKTFGYFCERNE